MNEQDGKKRKQQNKLPDGRRIVRPWVLAILGIAFLLFILLLSIVNWKVKDGDINVPSLSEVVFPSPTIDPAKEKPDYFYPEDYQYKYEDVEVPEIKETIYSNQPKLELDFSENIHMTIGMGNDFVSSGIYLDPTLTYEFDYRVNENEPYVFIMRADNGQIVYPDDLTPGKPEDGMRYYYLADRTYDRVVSASFNYEKNNGLKWYLDEYAGDRKDVDSHIYIHAVRIRDGFLMGSAIATISQDTASGNYQIVSLENADVRHTENMSEELRTAVIFKALEFINEDNTFEPLYVTEEEYNMYSDAIVVEKRDRVIYSRLFDAQGNPSPAGKFTSYDPYMVSFQDTGHGYITIYLRPIDSANKNKPLTDADSLCVFAYDAWSPFTVTSFNQAMWPEDAEYFGIK